MNSVSTSISSGRQAKVSGYQISKLVKQRLSETLPMNVALISQPLAGYAGAFSPVEITSSEQAGILFGFGSPIHLQSKILRPVTGGGLEGIPLMVYPVQSAANTLSSAEISITGEDVSLKSSTHSIFVNGEEFSYAVPAKTSKEDIVLLALKTLNNNRDACVVAVAGSTATKISLTSKGSGAIGQFKVRYAISKEGVGISYATETESSSDSLPSTADIDLQLALFGDRWHTIVINSFGTEFLKNYEEFNGDPNDSDGRYLPELFMPFVVVNATTESNHATLLALIDSNTTEESTNIIFTAPKSQSQTYMIAAEVGLILAKKSDAYPQLDVSEEALSHILPSDDLSIGDLSKYDFRDELVKGGISTVLIRNGQFSIEDFITTYRPEGENPRQYSYVRNLILDWNIKYGYTILEKINVRNKVLFPDNQLSAINNSVSPKQWKAVLFSYFDNLALRGLINDASFSKNSLVVEIDSSNPNRFNTRFSYQRTGFSRIQSTTVEAGF